MWYGEHRHTLDDKDRFVLPAKFREKLKSLKQRRFFVTRGLDGCLFLFLENAWQKQKDKLKSLSFTKQQSRFFNRLYFSGASEVEVDSQGRISVPAYLKGFAHIQREIVIVGVVDRIEIWDKASWSKFYEGNRANFEEMAENLFEI